MGSFIFGGMNFEDKCMLVCFNVRTGIYVAVAWLWYMLTGRFLSQQWDNSQLNPIILHKISVEVVVLKESINKWQCRDSLEADQPTVWQFPAHSSTEFGLKQIWELFISDCLWNRVGKGTCTAVLSLYLACFQRFYHSNSHITALGVVILARFISMITLGRGNSSYKNEVTVNQWLFCSWEVSQTSSVEVFYHRIFPNSS